MGLSLSNHRIYKCRRLIGRSLSCNLRNCILTTSMRIKYAHLFPMMQVITSGLTRPVGHIEDKYVVTTCNLFKSTSCFLSKTL